MTDRTANYKFELVEFNTKPWHHKEHNNWRQLDAILATLTTIVNISGVWDNATSYTVGQRLVDGDDGTLWTCAVAHTSASTGLFATDRASNPTYWTTFTVDQRFRGSWDVGIEYAVNDFVVYEAGNIYAVCVAAHTSGATFAGDSDNWTNLVDLSADIATIAAYAAAAAASAVAAAASAASISLPSIATDRLIIGNAAGTAWEALSGTAIRSIVGLVTAADKMIYTTASNVYAVTTLTAYGRSIVAVADEAAFKSLVNLEIGTDVLSPSGSGANLTGVLTDSAESNIQTDAYTLTASDNGKTIYMNKGSAVNLTCPQNSTENLPTGFQVAICNYGAGQVTVVVEGTDNLRKPSDMTAKLRAQYSLAYVTKRASGEWVLGGDLEAV